MREKVRRLAETSSQKSITISDLSILDKDQRLVPFQLKPAQRDLLSNLTGRDLVLKGRQIGISSAVEAHYFCEANRQTERIAVLAHLDSTVQIMRDMQQVFYDSLLHKPKRTINNATRAYYPATKSTIYIGSAGNSDFGIGGTYSKVHGTEVALWKDATRILSGLLQGVPANGQVILESTPRGAQGWFYERCMEALEGDSDWTLHFYPWWVDAEYRLEVVEPLEYTDEEQALADKHGLTQEQINWRRSKQRELAWSFLQEYPEDPVTCFIGSGSQVFGDFKVYTPLADAKPIPGHEYVSGLDTGQDNDYSALSIIDATDNKEVFIGHWRHMPWIEIRRNVLDACAYWGVIKLYVERNAASATIEALDADAYERKLPMSISGITTTLKRKGEMVIHLRTALQEEGLELLDEKWATSEMRAVQTKQTEQGVWTYTSPRDEHGHGDGVIARMLAVRAGLNRIGEQL